MILGDKKRFLPKEISRKANVVETTVLHLGRKI
jgi:hypothetical protein